MKALIIIADNGLEYDDYQDWPDACILVPDDFDQDAAWSEFTQAQSDAGIIKLTRRGGVYARDAERCAFLWKAWLKARYQEVELVIKRD